ncbi:hypothetical protein Pelo_4860 [Pelomyxa schiedti]|nr:hypothetical protein Pelo_4860 [Pelomyxa schiedti]
MATYCTCTTRTTQATGISHTELVNHVLGGSWVKWGLSAKAVCSRCNGKDGEPVEISLWSLPDFTTSFDVGMHSNIHPKELITFHITPKCSSTRSHIKSKIVFRVSTIPGIRTLTSNAISLCSRARYHDNQRSEGTNKFLLASCTSPPPASPLLLHFHLELLPSLKRTATPEEFHFNHNKTENCITPTTDHTKGTMELVSLKTTSSRQYIVDSRSNPKLPESTIAGIPERILRRPAIFVSIMSIREEHFITLFKALCELQSSLGFTFHHGKISSNMFLLAAIHNSVENFCYCSEDLVVRRKWMIKRRVSVSLSSTDHLELRTDSDVMYMHNQYTMRLIVNTMWRQSSGFSHTDLSNYVLGGSWVKWGLNSKATCSKCNGKNGEPAEISLWSLPETTTSFDLHSHSQEVITFYITPKCSSTRTHIKSKIVYLVTTIPGIGAFSSNSISLCSRARNHCNQLRLSGPLRLLRPSPDAPQQQQQQQQHSHLYTKTDSHHTTTPGRGQQEFTSALAHIKGTLEFVSLKTTSNRQCIVDSRFIPKLPQSTIAGIPERIFRRPVVFISIMSIREENFLPLFKALSDFQSSFDFTIQYCKISSNLFILAAIHKSVENFCYGSNARSGFITGNNPFHMDFSQPNDILQVVGRASNTF